MHIRSVIITASFLVSVVVGPADAVVNQRKRIGVPYYTIESEHFRIHYMKGLEHVAREAGGNLEQLYGIYRNRYNLKLPRKTDVLVTSDEHNYKNFAFSNTNFLSLAANDFEFNLRGSGNYFRDVVAHEYAHVVSIWTAIKTPRWIPYLQFGTFSHPNEKNRADVFHLYPSEILPPWFSEGIAQFESTTNGGDRWDSHRDMILRTLTLSDALLSWDHMQVFAGKGDDFEKTYNHGFSLITYIDKTYGYGSIVSILRESSRMHRLNFDRSIKEVLGISGRELYHDWKQSLQEHYKNQLDAIGMQVYGRKINKDGFDNYYPRYSPDGEKIFFLSNGKNDYSFKYRSLFSYATSDTVKDDERIKPVAVGIKGIYDLDEKTGRFVFSSTKSPKSRTDFEHGYERKRDLFIDTIPPDKKRPFAHKTEKQITEKQSLFMASFSPDGTRLASAYHVYDRFYLALLDTAGKNISVVYPPVKDEDSAFQTIYSIDWSPDGHTIALSYVERSGDRKIGLYDTESSQFSVFCDTPSEERDPRFSRDGSWLYFASDRTGIFNLYRYRFADSTLQRITNVTGGAFAPDLSPDGTSVVYVNYDKDGYGIYVLDSIAGLDSTTVAQPFARRAPIEKKHFQVSFSKPAPYSRLPRQFMLIPTVINEETVSNDRDVSEGVKAVKAGVAVNLWDPVSMAKRGNTLGGYFLAEPPKLSRFKHPSDVVEDPQVDYDLGAFYFSDVLPVDFSLEYNLRNIAGTDYAIDYAGEIININYDLSPRQLSLQLTKPLSDFSNMPLKLHSVLSYNWYHIDIIADGYAPFQFPAEQGGRIGFFTTMADKKADQWSSINPRGLYAKLKWDRYFERLQNQEEGFEADGISVNYDDYVFDQVSGDIRFGQEMPWKHKHALYAQIRGAAVRLTNANREHLRENDVPGRLPSFYEPIAWVPGYAYYYRRHLTRSDDKDSIADTVLVSGSVVGQGSLSYRFPLWPRLIDRKLGFIYFEHLLGAVNFNMGAGWNNRRDVLSTTFDSFLKSVGAELRIETRTFGVYPMAISLRWDRGFDKPEPVGGDRFTFNLGFSFDNWAYIETPDYHTRPVSRKIRRF